MLLKDMSIIRTAVHRKARSRISNGRLWVGVDARTKAARRYRDLQRAWTAELGGNLSASQRVLLDQAVALQVQAEESHCRIVLGEAVDPEQLVRLANSVSRILSRLGLGKRGGKKLLQFEP